MRARLAAGALCLAACRPLGPEATLARYFRALDHGRIEEAYALTTSAYRARHDLQGFAAAVARQPRWSGAALGRVETVVELRAQDGEPIVVEGSGPDARLATDPLDLWANDTPEHAVRSFARAMRLERHAVLGRLLAPSLAVLLHARPDDPLARELVRAATVARTLLSPTAGLPVGVLVLTASGARLLLGDGRALVLDHGVEGWVVSSVE